MSSPQQKEPKLSTFAALQSLPFCETYQNYLQIAEEDILKWLKDKFPELEPESRKCLREKQFYLQLKKLYQNYIQLAGFIATYRENIMEDSGHHKSQAEPRRKVTRSVFAMRNQKSQEELRKDQIFVRVMPRSQSCIQFMLKNRNFPRIQCKLSCNQHLQYLVNFLTNKWLRGKVGMGYQIVLYPDASKYLRKTQNQERSEAVHEPLNNYLMFTDIMSACGINQNGCLNLFYDITELRKQKKKPKKPIITSEKESFGKEKYQIKVSEASQKGKKEEISLQKKIQQNAQHILENHEDISMGNPREISLKVPSMKPHENFHNHSIDDSSLFGSLGFHWRSNYLASNFFNNNSNTLLNGGGQIVEEQEVKGGNEKLQNLRNYISIIEKEADNENSEIAAKEIPEKDDSIQKEEVNQKKEVKTVVITKKKNQE